MFPFIDFFIKITTENKEQHKESIFNYTFRIRDCVKLIWNDAEEQILFYILIYIYIYIHEISSKYICIAVIERLQSFFRNWFRERSLLAEWLVLTYESFTLLTVSQSKLNFEIYRKEVLPLFYDPSVHTISIQSIQLS